MVSCLSQRHEAPTGGGDREIDQGRRVHESRVVAYHGVSVNWNRGSDQTANEMAMIELDHRTVIAPPWQV